MKSSNHQQSKANPLSWLRERFGLKGRLATSDAVLMLISVLGPVLAGLALDRTEDIALVVFGAFQTGLVSVNGLYRQRSRAKLTLLGIMLLELIWVNIMGSGRLLRAVSTFVIMLLIGRSAALGTTSAAVGLASAMAFIVMQALYSSIGWGPELAHACFLMAIGGLWTLTINFLSWVAKAHTPLAQAVGDIFAALARTVCSGRQKDPKDPEWAVGILASFETVGGTLSTARSLWSSASGGNSRTGSPRELELLSLIESADRVASELVLCAEHISHFWAEPGMEALHDPMAQAWTSLEKALDSMLTALDSRHRDPQREVSDLRTKVEEFSQCRESLRRQTMDDGESQAIASLLSARAVVESLERITSELERSGSLAIVLTPRTFIERFRKFNPLGSMEPAFSLRDWSTLDRHALRYAAMVTFGSQLGSLPVFSHGYWIPLHIAIVLKPDFGGTAQRSLERTMGTLWGSLLGMALVVLIPMPQLLVGLLLALLFCAMAVRPLKYSLFVTFLTPAVILLIQLTHQEGWEVGLARLLSSLVGVGLAMLGVAFLFPASERTGVRALFLKALTSHAKLFEEVVRSYITNSKPSKVRALARWRYQAAADNANLSTAIGRALAQPGHEPCDEQDLPILMSRLRRFSASVNALSFYRPEFASRFQNSHFTDFCLQVTTWLNDLMEALEQGRPPKPRPCLEEPLAEMRALVKKLQDERTHEYREHPDRDTELAKAVRDQTPVLTQLERIAEEMEKLKESVAIWSEN